MRALRRETVVIWLGRTEVVYPAAGEMPRISVAGQQLAMIGGTVAPVGVSAFALGAGPDSILISDRDMRLALLVPRDSSPLQDGRASIFVAWPDGEHPGQLRLSVIKPPPTGGVLYLGGDFGHATGWGAAVHDALVGLPDAAPVPCSAAIRRPDYEISVGRKVADVPSGMHAVPIDYSETESATITRDDVLNRARPELWNREAALLWLADNLTLARESASAAVIVNGDRPEAWMLHQLAEHARLKRVPLHAVRYAALELAELRALAAQARSPDADLPAGLAELALASTPAIHTRRELEAALCASEIDLRRHPAADFETASRAMMASVPAHGTIWYQAIDWRDRLSLESGPEPYVVIPPPGRACALSPDEAAARAGLLVARHAPELRHIFTSRDPRGVVLVAQERGPSAHGRRHWRAMLELAPQLPDVELLFAGGSAEDRAWLSRELEAAGPRNVTLLGWPDEDWSTLLRALAAKPRASFVCRPGLGSIGAALANGIPPLLMAPDPLVAQDGRVDPQTVETAMERAVYAFQLDRLYAAQCAGHRESPLPILVDTLGEDREKALATLRRALEPAVQVRQRTAIAGYCNWSRAAHVIGKVIAREAAGGPLPIAVKRRLRDQELSIPRAPREGLPAPGAIQRRAYSLPSRAPRVARGDGPRLVAIEREDEGGE